MSKAYLAGLRNNVVSSYDKTKTTVFGRMALRTFDGVQVLSTPTHRFADVMTDTGIVPLGPMHKTENGRMFVVQYLAAVAQILLYNIDAVTGEQVYVGRLNAQLPSITASVHTIRGIRVVDGGVAGWKIFIATTATITLQVGGVHLVNNVGLADFVKTGYATIPTAVGLDQKGVYLLQDPALPGFAHVQTAATGIARHASANQLVLHNGVAANHQFYFYDTTQAPDCPTSAVTSMPIASPGVVNTDSPHGLAAGDIVQFQVDGGSLPPLVVPGVAYFVMAAGLGATTFQVSATVAGVGINFAVAGTGTITWCRAAGQTTSLFNRKTGSLTALVGTLLTNGSESFAQPSHTALAGEECLFFATSSNLYLGKISDLTSGATAWPSLMTVNILGTVNQITVPTAVCATWAQDTDCAVYMTNLSLLVIKRMYDNQILSLCSGLNTTYQETMNRPLISFATATAVNIEERQGWLFVSCSTIGQRGVFIMDLKSDALFGYSAFITPVMKVPATSVLRNIAPIEHRFDDTCPNVLYYRLSNFDSGNLDGPEWIVATESTELGVEIPSEIQFQSRSGFLSGGSPPPAMSTDFQFVATSRRENSENWRASEDDSSRNSESPAYSAFRMTSAYVGVVPRLTVTAMDDLDNVVYRVNTVDHKSVFTFSADDGASWTTLVGNVVPNVAGTLLRVQWPTGIVPAVTVAVQENVA